MKKHFFFDMDGTLTPSRQAMSDGFYAPMKELASRFDVVIVSGASADQMARQVPEGVFPAVRLSQNGNVAMSGKRCPLWRNELNWIQKLQVFETIEDMINWVSAPVDPQDLVEDRGCQISYSATGHHADLGAKRAYDPDGEKRRELLGRVAGQLALLHRNGVKHAIGGTTCIDFYVHSKGKNVSRLVKEMGWAAEECVYLGDALFEGGNDETVKGVIDTVQVSGPDDALEFVRNLV